MNEICKTCVHTFKECETCNIYLSMLLAEWIESVGYNEWDEYIMK